MNCHLYLRKSILYVPTMGKMDKGFYRGIEPVAVVSASNSEAVRECLGAAIARGNPVAPVLPRRKMPPPVLLKYAGVKSWSEFERGMLFWTIEKRDDIFQIAGQKKYPDGMWRDDPEQVVTLLPGASTDSLIERMTAILQNTAR